MRRIVLFAAYAAVAFVSLWPRSCVEEYVPGEIQAKDYLIHAVCYLMLAACTAWARGSTARPRRALLFSWLVCSGYGLLMEVLQMMPVVNRSFQWSDVAENALGALAGVFLGRWLAKHI